MLLKRYLHQYMPDAHVRVSELDPDVIELARKHFQLRENDRYRVFAMDGRLFLRRQQAQFDVILVDAYRGPFVPFHLLTREFYELAKKRLAPGGVVAQNVEPSTMLFDSAVATMRAVFETVDMYPGGGNVVVVAYDGPRRDLAHAQLVRSRSLDEFGRRCQNFLYPRPRSCLCRLTPDRRVFGHFSCRFGIDLHS